MSMIYVLNLKIIGIHHHLRHLLPRLDYLIAIMYHQPHNPIQVQIIIQPYLILRQHLLVHFNMRLIRLLIGIFT
jgi:hypothetical protein